MAWRTLGEIRIRLCRQNDPTPRWLMPAHPALVQPCVEVRTRGQEIADTWRARVGQPGEESTAGFAQCLLLRAQKKTLRGALAPTSHRRNE